MFDQDGAKMLYEAFFAIAESYTSILYLDTTDGSAHSIRLDGYSMRYQEMLNAHPPMKDVIGEYIRDAVYKDDAVGLMRHADCEYVIEKLRTENPIRYIYRSLIGDRIEYYRLKIVPVEEGKKLIYGFENIDSQYRRQLEIEAEKEKQMTLLDGLSREYMSVWFLDGKSRKVTLIKNNGTESQNGEAVRIGNTMVDYHFSMQKYFGEFAKPEDFDRLMDETSYDNLVANAGEDDLYSINYIRINPDMSTSHFQVCYAKITDNQGIANFVFGFRTIDLDIE